MRYIVIDSGTTNTRVRLSDGTQILHTAAAPVGARTTAVKGDNRSLRRELRRLIQETLQAGGLDLSEVEALIASGMITSDVGLLEVPHLLAPAAPHDLAKGMVSRRFEEICNRSIMFIPGVKTQPGADPEVLAGDVLRGEEVEVSGLRTLLKLSGPATFLHFGSHHKAVRTGERGEILSSETVLTGELLQAVSEHTILSSTVLPACEVRLDETFWRLGLQVTQRDGLGRALFTTRLTQQLHGFTAQQSSNFLLGALASLDLPMVFRALRRGDRLVLYGGGHFAAILHRYLETEGWGDQLSLVDQERVELAGVLGAIWIYECHARGERGV